MLTALLSTYTCLTFKLGVGRVNSQGNEHIRKDTSIPSLFELGARSCVASVLLTVDTVTFQMEVFAVK